mmetsp:Transcript_23874/g.45464  ORF Transcript_23874/g.45464 Transcript_23874/m.45464 type:complete len:226 (-) Transcript_23874:342-1019(-)
MSHDKDGDVARLPAEKQLQKEVEALEARLQQRDEEMTSLNKLAEVEPELVPEGYEHAGLSAESWEGTPEQEAELEQTRLALEAELQDTEEMLMSLQLEQSRQAKELGHMRELFTSELQELKDESWKYEAYAELEQLKELVMRRESLASVEAQARTAESSQQQSDEQDTFDPLMDELEADMEAIGKQLAEARALRDEMEQKKRALQSEMDMFMREEGLLGPTGEDL